MSNKECCVCYEETDKENFKVLSPCNHEICSTCMREYIKRLVSTCPMCRSDFNIFEHIREHNGRSYIYEFIDTRVLPLQPIPVMGMISTVDVYRNIVVRVDIPLPDWRNEINLAFSNERS